MHHKYYPKYSEINRIFAFPKNPKCIPNINPNNLSVSSFLPLHPPPNQFLCFPYKSIALFISIVTWHEYSNGICSYFFAHHHLSSLGGGANLINPIFNPLPQVNANSLFTPMNTIILEIYDNTNLFLNNRKNNTWIHKIRYHSAPIRPFRCLREDI